MEKFQNYKNSKIAGLILIGLSIVSLTILFSVLSINDNTLLMMIPSFILLNLGISALLFNKSEFLRKRIVIIVSSIAFFLLITGFIIRYLSSPATPFSINNSLIDSLPPRVFFLIIGGLPIAFLCGPLEFILKYEKWKFYARSSKNAFKLSLADLLGKSGLIIGIIFKLMHWPAAQLILIFGFFIFILSYLFWNKEFQKEVVLRKEAEDKLNLTNIKLKAQNSVIEEKNNELNNLFEEVNKQREEIVASINYAKLIQQAVLPSEDSVTEILQEHFILFKPKDIVSGDFYWVKKIKNFTIVVCADCTGHGVPGAFMSMLGISFLNEIVTKRGLDSSGEILNRLRAKIKKSLNQKGTEGERTDGMDISLYIIDYETLDMQFSGAFNPLIIVRDNELIQYQADRQPISIHPNETDFNTTRIKLEKGDVCYTFSDGYADQPGGKSNKKFMLKKFKDLLLEISIKPIRLQKESLDETFESWKGGYEQIDDVLVVGVRI